MAEEFLRLNKDLDNLETATGQEWNDRDLELARTLQARLNFIITRVFAYLHPGTLTQQERNQVSLEISVGLLSLPPSHFPGADLPL